MEIKYNNLENIDLLIEKLESNLPTSTINDVRVKKALSKRNKQILELKKIRDEARKQVEIEAELARIERVNDEIDDVIVELKKLVKVKKEEINNKYNYNQSSYSQASCSYYSSESRCGESNYSYQPSCSSYPCSSESRSSESRW